MVVLGTPVSLPGMAVSVATVEPAVPVVAPPREPPVQAAMVAMAATVVTGPQVLTVTPAVRSFPRPLAVPVVMVVPVAQQAPVARVARHRVLAPVVLVETVVPADRQALVATVGMRGRAVLTSPTV